MRFWKNSCGCGKPSVLDHNIRSHWIATLEWRERQISASSKKGGHLLAKCDVYGRKNFVESE
jgi:hypothetical protein